MDEIGGDDVFGLLFGCNMRFIWWLGSYGKVKRGSIEVWDEIR